MYWSSSNELMPCRISVTIVVSHYIGIDTIMEQKRKKIMHNTGNKEYDRHVIRLREEISNNTVRFK